MGGITVTAGSFELGPGEIGPSLKDTVDHLVEDGFGPARLGKPSDAETHEQIARQGGMEHVGVVDGGERDILLGSVLETQVLCFSGELVEHFSTVLIISALVVEEVRQQDLPTVPDPPERDLAFLEELDHVRPRDVEQVGRLLGGELRGDGRDGDGVAVGDLGEDVDEEADHEGRDRDPGGFRVGVVGAQLHPEGWRGVGVEEGGELGQRFGCLVGRPPVGNLDIVHQGCLGHGRHLLSSG
jgi:hypothetical protein